MLLRPARRLASAAALAALTVVLPVGPAAAQSAASLRDDVATTPDPDPDVLVHGRGWGHSVGMSQYGAYAMALAGHSASDILTHYYQGTAIGTADTSGAVRVGLYTGATLSSVEAVGGTVRWQSCSGSPLQCSDVTAGGQTIPRQPDGTQWLVDATPDGMVLQRHGELADVAIPGSKLRAIWDESTTRILGVNPNTTSRVEYRWGFREFVFDGTSDDLDVVQVFPGCKTGATLPCGIEAYLRGLGEVPASWGVHGRPALDAQAIAGRTFTMRSLGNEASCSCDLVATPAAQAYVGYGKETGAYGTYWRDAVVGTRRQVLTYQGQMIPTYYSSSHGGRSEAVEDSWAYGTTPVPYLVSVDDHWSALPSVNGHPVGNSRAFWTARVDNGTLARYLDPALARITRLVPTTSRTGGGTPRELSVAGIGSGGDPMSLRWSRPSADRKPIAGANLRLDVRDVDGAKLNSQQISRFGFAPFTDDDGHLHEYSIVFVESAGIASGTTATTFRPNHAVTRAQMASFLYRMLDLPPGDPGRFSDVDSTDVHAEAIAAVAEAGIAQGYPDGTYRPAAAIDRAQMATFLARALDLPPGEADGRFVDVAPGAAHTSSIYAIADAGVTGGCKADRYCPTQPVSRGQMATFLYAAVRYLD